MFQDVREAVAAIECRRRNKRDLEGFRRFIQTHCPGYAQLSYIHIAGTNGKGSTLNYLRSMLNALGYRVATLTSPALESHFDRIRIDDRWMPQELFLSLVNRYYEAWDAQGFAMFDIDVHLALEWFVQEHVDFVLLETGMGGRLDATNIVVPRVSVITNIGHDHMRFLGDTLEEIAMEKAGIIKEGVPLVTAEKRKECLAVFAQVCAQRHAPMVQVKTPQAWMDKEEGVCFDYGEWKQLRLSTMALYQASNAALALQTLQVLFPTLPQYAVREGLAKAQWAGRFQIVCRDPLVIIDGAHNREGIEALCDTLRAMAVDTVIFSVLEDKECERMIESLRAVCKQIILCSFAQGRLADLTRLAKRYQLRLADDLKELLQERMEKDRQIVVCGSLYFVSEAYRLFFPQTKESTCKALLK